MSTAQLDFAEIKQAATAEYVVGFLGLKLAQKDDTFRGACPLCKTNSREFVITGSKKLFHCFKCKKGGDMLKLVSEVKGLGLREAAAELAQACGVEKKAAPPPAANKAFDVEKYAERLDPEHAALEPLGVSPDTLREWKAGYASSGVHRGRLALPIHSQTGVIGYMGMEINPDQPTLVFPNGIDPRLYIFGYGIAAGPEIYLTRSPLDVLQAWDSGFKNALSFLTETISSSQLQYLSALMDHSRVEGILLM